MSAISVRLEPSRFLGIELAQPLKDLEAKLALTPPESPKKLSKEPSLGNRDVIYLSPEKIYLVFDNTLLGDEMIGAGTSKRVFRALDITAQKVVACVQAKWSLSLENELATRRMFAGNEHLQKAPLGVLRTDEGGDSYLTMFDHLYQGDLNRLYKADESEADTVSLDQKQKLTKELLLGLKQLHDRGLLHRDIKPANVFIDGLDDKKVSSHLADFGETVSEGDREAMVRRAGSPEFFSPEYLDYQNRPLETPARKGELEHHRAHLEAELLSIVSPGAAKLSPLAVFKFEKANPEHETFQRLGHELKSVKAEISALKGFKDFSSVTTQKHDLYALGLTLLGLFTSQKTLELVLASNRAGDFKDITHDLFDGYLVDRSSQDLLIGLLRKDPGSRFGWRELEPYIL